MTLKPIIRVLALTALLLGSAPAPVTRPTDPPVVAHRIVAVAVTPSPIPTPVPTPAKKAPTAVPRPKVSDWKPYAIVEKYKDRPVLTLKQNAQAKAFTFGIVKARMILELLPAIQQFVAASSK